MSKELKRTIINWLLDNKNRWQRVIDCCRAFRPYIFDAKGNYLIGGKEVLDFIRDADKLLYR